MRLGFSRSVIDAVEVLSVMAVVLLLAYTFSRNESADVSIEIPVDAPIIARKAGVYFTEATGDPVNCTGSWVADAAGTCSASCGGGNNMATFIITVDAANNGTACPALNGTNSSTPCNTHSCTTVYDPSTTCLNGCDFGSLEVGVPMGACSCPNMAMDNFILTSDSALGLTEGQTFSVKKLAEFLYEFNFSGGANSNVVFEEGSQCNVHKKLGFKGPHGHHKGHMKFHGNSGVKGEGSKMSFYRSSSVDLGDDGSFDMDGGAFGADGGDFNGRGEGFRFKRGNGHKANGAKFGANVDIDGSTAIRRQAGAVDFLSCSNTFNGLTVRVNVIMTVDMTSTCTAANAAYSTTVVDLAVQASGKLKLVNVGPSSKAMLVSNSFTFDSAADLEVSVISTISTAQTLIRYASAAACAVPTRSTVTTGYLLSAATDPSAVNYCLIQIAPPAVTTTTGGGSREIGSFSVLLDQDCTTFTSSAALTLLVKYNYDASRLSVTTACASTLMTVTCSGAGAAAYCAGLYNDILNSNSGLFGTLKPLLGTNRDSGDSSNKGLLGLLALIAIPVIIVIVVIIVIQTKKKEEVYLEDMDEVNQDEKPVYQQGYQPASYQFVPSYTQNPPYANSMTPRHSLDPCPAPATTPAQFQ